MSTVRGDLDGVVWYSVEGQPPQSLKAGDTVPEGVSLGDHVVAKPKDAEAKPRQTRRKSST